LRSAYFILYTETPKGLQFASEEGFMHIPRLLPFALLISACVVPLAAQSSPSKNPVSSRPLLDGLITPPEFRTNAPTLEFHGLLVGQSPEAIPKPYAPKLESREQDPTPTNDDMVCLYIRSYRVIRDDPKSDSTRFAGYSECQPTARFQMKSAVDSLEIDPR
jgi:hypothetical protein